jgi:hypothetical protein
MFKVISGYNMTVGVPALCTYSRKEEEKESKGCVTLKCPLNHS